MIVLRVPPGRVDFSDFGSLNFAGCAFWQFIKKIYSIRCLEFSQTAFTKFKKLNIGDGRIRPDNNGRFDPLTINITGLSNGCRVDDIGRSEKRRVGKECLRLCRSRGGPSH